MAAKSSYKGLGSGDFERLGLQDELLEKPMVVRLKFMGSMPGGRETPQHGGFRDVRVRSLEELVDAVEDWLGAPGTWQLCTAANWPVTLEYIQRPTTFSCPVLVLVKNTQEDLHQRIDKLYDELESRRLMQAENLRTEIQSVVARMEKAEEAVRELSRLSHLNTKVHADERTSCCNLKLASKRGMQCSLKEAYSGTIQIAMACIVLLLLFRSYFSIQFLDTQLAHAQSDIFSMNHSLLSYAKRRTHYTELREKYFKMQHKHAELEKVVEREEMEFQGLNQSVHAEMEEIFERQRENGERLSKELEEGLRGVNGTVTSFLSNHDMRAEIEKLEKNIRDDRDSLQILEDSFANTNLNFSGTLRQGMKSIEALRQGMKSSDEFRANEEDRISSLNLSFVTFSNDSSFLKARLESVNDSVVQNADEIRKVEAIVDDSVNKTFRPSGSSLARRWTSIEKQKREISDDMPHASRTQNSSKHNE